MNDAKDIQQFNVQVDENFMLCKQQTATLVKMKVSKVQKNVFYQSQIYILLRLLFSPGKCLSYEFFYEWVTRAQNRFYITQYYKLAEKLSSHIII